MNSVVCNQELLLILLAHIGDAKKKKNNVSNPKVNMSF